MEGVENRNFDTSREKNCGKRESAKTFQIHLFIYKRHRMKQLVQLERFILTGNHLSHCSNSKSVRKKFLKFYENFFWMFKRICTTLG
jgi:hypothetical protein